MKRGRIIIAAIFAASTMALVAPATPAYACPPDEQMPCQCADDINRIWQKLTGGPLIHCPW